ncbi:MAG: flagellar protein FlaG [Cycloclasticus sp.]
METVNLQSVLKAVSSKAPSVAVSPADVAVSKVKLESEVAGKVLPLANELNESQDVQKKLEETVSDLNSFVQSIQRGIQFSVHEETGRSVITITDRETGQEIRKFPSDQVLAIAEHISETLAVADERGVGLLVNGKA